MGGVERNVKKRKKCVVEVEVWCSLHAAAAAHLTAADFPEQSKYSRRSGRTRGTIKIK
jgi:hypothetical protein